MLGHSISFFVSSRPKVMSSRSLRALAKRHPGFLVL